MTTATTTDTTTTTKTQEPKKDPCTASKVKVGDLWTRHSAGEVTAIRGNSIMLKNTNGLEWSITSDILEKEFSFADQYDTEEKLSRTAVIEILVEAPQTAMTVCFNKKVDHKNVAKVLSEGQGELTARAWNKKVKETVGGEEAIVVGFHTRNFDEHRRLRFIKLGGKGGYRLVDPRTLQWVIVNRTKYVVKS